MKTKILYGVCGLLVILSSILWWSYSKTQQKLQIAQESETLLKADKDSLSKSFDKETASYEYTKLGWMASKATLEKHLKENNKELYDLKKRNNAQAGLINEYKIKIKDKATSTIVEGDTTSKITTHFDSTNNIKIVEKLIVDTSRRIHIFDQTPNYKATVESTIYGGTLDFDLLGKTTVTIDKNGKVQLNDKNPYIDHTKVDVFIEKEKPKKKSILAPLGIGISIGVVGTLLLLN